MESGIRGSDDMTVLARFDVTGTFGIAKNALLGNGIEIFAVALQKHWSMDQKSIQANL